VRVRETRGHRRPLTAAASASRDRSIATTFVRVLSVYGIGLRGHVVADGATWSDHASFEGSPHQQEWRDHAGDRGSDADDDVISHL
jgi:hypothetical protein